MSHICITTQSFMLDGNPQAYKYKLTDYQTKSLTPKTDLNSQGISFFLVGLKGLASHASMVENFAPTVKFSHIWSVHYKEFFLGAEVANTS